MTTNVVILKPMAKTYTKRVDQNGRSMNSKGTFKMYWWMRDIFPKSGLLIEMSLGNPDIIHLCFLFNCFIFLL